MPEKQQSYTKSPSQPRQSHKVYDYLIDHPASNQKYSHRPIIADHSPYSKQQTQYQLIVQFQLRRQKQKTIILQQRLKNKQSFIKQMKQFQDQLTLAFQKCQQELQYYKTQCQDYQSRFNSFATFNNGTLNNVNDASITANQPQTTISGQQQIIRQYVQEIAELKHLVIRLEEQINLYQKKQKMNSCNKYMSSSVKKQLYPVQQISGFNTKNSKKFNQASPTKKQKQKIQQAKKQRSKTLANQFVQQKNTQNFNTYTKISEFIQQQNRKILSFINHFLTMCQFFQQSIQKQTSIKHKLKKAWKWVKTAIVQWNYLKTQKIQKVKQYKIGNIVTKLLPLNNLSIPQIQKLLEKILKNPIPAQTVTKRQ